MYNVNAAAAESGLEVRTALQDHPFVWRESSALKLLNDHLGFDSVLVPLDGSTFSEWALPPAAAIARKSHGLLTLIHAWDPAPHPVITGFLPPAIPADMPAVIASKEYLEDISNTLLHNSERVQTEILIGQPVKAVQKYVSCNNIDLIVMTTHGHTGMSRLWLGSFADAIVRASHVPVLLWKTRETTSRSVQDRMFSHILVPLSGATPAEDILPHALKLGRLFDARYTLLQVVRPVTIPVYPYPAYATAWEPDPEGTDKALERANDYLNDVVGRLKRIYRGVRIDTEVIIDDNPASAILQTAAAQNVDLVAMATQARRGTRLLLGGVADKVLRGTDCPVMMALPA